MKLRGRERIHRSETNRLRCNRNLRLNVTYLFVIKGIDLFDRRGTENTLEGSRSGMVLFVARKRL